MRQLVMVLLAGFGMSAPAWAEADSSSASADVAATARAPAPASGFTTSSHLGFGVTDRSSTEFKGSSGSLVFLDVTHAAWHGVELGLRTSAYGGRLPGREFYRLGAGPLVSYKVNETWVLQASASLFNETALGEGGETLYHSRGQALQLGWERIYALAPRVEAALGGFVSGFRGSVTSPGGAETAAAAMNLGACHGFEAAIRLRL